MPHIGAGYVVASALLLLLWQGYTIFKDMMRTIKTHVEYAFFFVLLFGLTLLGDGKQPMVDILGGAGVLCMVVMMVLREKRFITPSPPVQYAWGGVFIYLIARTAVSDSIGYSISSVLRWCMAYCVFVLFISYAREKTEEVFRRMVFWFGLSVIALAWVYSSVPFLGKALAGMNLLYPAYGHNHVANIIVFLFPIALHIWLEKKNHHGLGSLALVLCSLVLSFARGAWLLIGGYVALDVYFHKNMSGWLKAGLIGMAMFVVGGAVFLGIFHNVPHDGQNVHPLSRLAVKPSILESRLPYWQQAIQAIQERPLFGSGPGTFYLLSQRFQERPQTYSWFAHSFPLESIAELGLIGFGGVSFLLWIILSRAHRGPLFIAVLLTLAYSLYEINLNFLVIWLLFWASIGTIYNQKTIQSPVVTGRRDPLLFLSIVIIGVSYCSSVVSTVASMSPSLLSFYSEPHVIGRAVTALERRETPLSVVSFIERVHAKDPQAHQSIALYWDKQNNVPRATAYYLRAITLDPKNIQIRKKYIAFLLKHEVYDKAFERIVFEARQWTRFGYALPEVIFTPGSITGKNSGDLVELLASPWDDLLFAKIFYLFGLALLEESPQKTDEYWKVSQMLAPTWNYFYIERASLAKFKHNDANAVKTLLRSCIDALDGDLFCETRMRDSDQIPQPGTLRKDVMNMY